MHADDADEHLIAAVARRQDNVISWRQLCDAGFGRGVLARRLREGTMQRLHRGVYLLGSAPPTPAARARAAVLACGSTAVISHRTAAALWRLLTDARDVHVTVTGHHAVSRPGIIVHRARSIEARRLRGIPLTSPARTLCDIAATEPASVLERALNETRVLGLVNERELQRAIDSAPRRRGAARLRWLLDEAPTITRNDAERQLLTLIAKADLPRPRTNAPLLGFNVDFLWPAQRLVVEFDGFAAHGHRQAFERDRRRDRTLAAAGYRVIRITWRQVIAEPFAVIAHVAQALSAAA